MTQPVKDVRSLWLVALLLCSLSACQTAVPPRSAPVTPAAKSGAIPPPTAQPHAPVSPTSATQVPPAATLYSTLEKVGWQGLPDMQSEDWLAGWPAWLQGCQALQKKAEWQAVCLQAQALDANDSAAIAAYWQQYFEVYRVHQAGGEVNGMMTGYYQPVLRGAYAPSERYHVPLYRVPADLIQVNLASLYPELKFKRLRGRLQGQTLVPYYSRADIEQAASPLAGNELLWLDDPVEAFFLQVQGSGVVLLENGERVHIGYADQNGHPYQSIGRVLVERGEMQASDASMQGIKRWGQQHPTQLHDLLNSNPSYVFFKLLPPGLRGPLGALGVPLTAARSIAIDPAYIPLGAPVYLATTYPNSSQPLQQLVFAQDTGGAIKGGVRADVYWGEGEAAGALAGAMRQPGQLWVWLPKGFVLPKAP